VLALTRLQGAADFVVLTGVAPPALPALGLLEGVPEEVLKRARWWEQHLQEIETGQRPDGSAPQERYDPARSTVEQRELAKLQELVAAGTVVGRRTLQR